jgi:hypothetical protein
MRFHSVALVIPLFFSFLCSAQDVPQQESLGDAARRIRQQDKESLGDAARRLRQNGQTTARNDDGVSFEGGERPSTPEEIAARRTNRKLPAHLGYPLNDPQMFAYKFYADVTADLLQMEDFPTLEQEAAVDREKRVRFPGGAFKLYWFYQGMRTAKHTNITPGDWREVFVHLQHWREEYPESVTAKMATAEAYMFWGWAARGTRYSENTTTQGMQLFEERSEAAEAMLDQVSKMKSKDPHFYYVQQELAIAQGWEPGRALASVKEAVASDSAYYHTFQKFAQYLSPKWYGEPGAAAAFGATLADQVKGKQGEFLYFSIANTIDCNCEGAEVEMATLVWPRVKKGYEAGEELYGVSWVKLNLLAHMAVTVHDRTAAKAAFAKIGANWDVETWGSLPRFREYKAWAYNVAPSELPLEVPEQRKPVVAGPLITSEPAQPIAKPHPSMNVYLGSATAIHDYVTSVGATFEADDFAALEAEANSVRAAKKKFNGGQWLIFMFYAATDHPNVEHPTDQDWERYFAKMGLWEKMFPKSITARVATSQAHLNYATQIMAGRAERALPIADLKKWAEQVALAQYSLQQAENEKIERKCPQAAFLMTKIMRLRHSRPEEADKVVKAAIDLEPMYYYTYQAYSAYLYDLHGGVMDASEVKFAEETANLVGGQRGDFLYFTIAETLSCRCDDEKEWKTISWKRAKDGYHAGESMYGIMDLHLNMYTKMASALGDHDAAKEGFAKLDKREMSAVAWRSREEYEARKKWAEQ